MTSPATTLLSSLKTQLQGITTANGYALTVASVSTGRSALAGDTDGPYPAITLTPLQDQPGANTAPQSPFQEWARTVVIEAVIQESADWDAELDVLWDAVRQALIHWTGIIQTWGPVELIPPGDGGGLCLLRLPLTFIYTLHFY